MIPKPDPSLVCYWGELPIYNKNKRFYVCSAKQCTAHAVREIWYVGLNTTKVLLDLLPLNL